MTVVVHAQGLPQIEAFYGREQALAILANWPHQVSIPPRDPQTAKLVSST
jgi:type IV secretory pathway TraG/TraD family ATPase VirD4